MCIKYGTILAMKTYKYRIYPTKAQETILSKMLEECRWLYNKIRNYSGISGDRKTKVKQTHF